MYQEEKTAYINAQVACALIEMEAMKAENEHRANQGLAQAYGEDAFMELIKKYNIHHNDVVGLLQS